MHTTVMDLNQTTVQEADEKENLAIDKQTYTHS